MLLERAVGKTRCEKVLSWNVRNDVEKNEVGQFESMLESTTEMLPI